jgi:hypothetical protein
MPALVSWVLLLGGIATTVAAAALSAALEFEAAIALGGLLATVLGAVGLVLSRVAGDAPSRLRPPRGTGASTSVVNPGAPGPRVVGPRGAVRRSAGASSATPLPTGGRRSAISRAPLLVAAVIGGVAWDLTMTEDGGPLDVLAGLILLFTPIAAVMAAATRILTGRAWGPAVTAVLFGAGVFIGAVAAEFALGVLA